MADGFLVTVKCEREGETIQDRMFVERPTREEAEATALAAFAESGDEWELAGPAVEVLDAG